MPPRRHNGDDTNSEDANGNANFVIQELANLISELVNQLTQAKQNINQNRGGANPQFAHSSTSKRYVLT